MQNIHRSWTNRSTQLITLTLWFATGTTTLFAQPPSEAQIERALRDYAEQLHLEYYLVKTGAEQKQIEEARQRWMKLQKQIKEAGESAIPVLIRTYDDALKEGIKRNPYGIRKYLTIFLWNGVERNYEPKLLTSFLDRIALTDPDPEIRRSAVEVMRLNPVLHIETLRKALDDKDDFVQSLASVYLSELRDPQFIALQMELTNHNSLMVRCDMMQSIVENTKTTNEQKVHALGQAVDGLRVEDAFTASTVAWLERYTGLSFGRYYNDKPSRHFLPSPSQPPQTSSEKQSIIDKWKSWFRENKSRLNWSERHGRFLLRSQNPLVKAEVRKMLETCAAILSKRSSPLIGQTNQTSKDAALDKQVSEILDSLDERLADDALPILKEIYHDALAEAASSRLLRYTIIGRMLPRWILTERVNFTPSPIVVELIQTAALEDPDATTRTAAMQLVERCPSPHSAVFRRMLRDSDSSIQRLAVLALNQYASRCEMKIADGSLKAEMLEIIRETKQLPSLRYQLSLSVIGLKGFTQEEKVEALGVLVALLGHDRQKDDAFRISSVHSSLQKLTGINSVKGGADWLRWFDSNKHRLLWDESKSHFILSAK